MRSHRSSRRTHQRGDVGVHVRPGRRPVNKALLPAAPAEGESGIGGIGCLLAEAPEDLPRGNAKFVIPEVIHADVHQPDQATLPTTRNRKCTTKIQAVELLDALLVGDPPPALPFGRRLDEPWSQMISARSTPIRADCIVRWHNPPLLEIVAPLIVPRVQNIFIVTAIS
jgi:hypothetical protein